MRKSGKLAKKGFSCVQVHPFSQEDLDDQISGIQELRDLSLVIKLYLKLIHFGEISLF